MTETPESIASNSNAQDQPRRFHLKSRGAFIRLVLVLGGLIVGGWMLWSAFQKALYAAPPWMAFVALGVAVLALADELPFRGFTG